MRVAICLWGICRSSQYTYESFKKNILDKLSEFGIRYHILLHTYTINTPYINGRARENGCIMDNDAWKIFKPNKFIVEDQEAVDIQLDLMKYRTHRDPWGSNFKDSTFNNHIRALYSLKQVTSLITERYYAVIYCRPDVRYMHPLRLEWFEPTLIKSSLQIPNFAKYPINDRFCLGSPSLCRVFGTRFDDAYEYSKHQSLHSEKFLLNTFRKHNIVLNEIPFGFRRVRATGIEVDKKIN